MLGLSHPPLPWIHDHCGVDAQRLACHLRSYHTNSGTGEPSNGWHIHLLPFAVAANDYVPDGVTPFFVGNYSLQRESTVSLGGKRPFYAVHVAKPGKRETAPLPGLSGRACNVKEFEQCETYRLLNVLLL